MPPPTTSTSNGCSANFSTLLFRSVTAMQVFPFFQPLALGQASCTLQAPEFFAKVDEQPGAGAEALTAAVVKADLLVDTPEGQVVHDAKLGTGGVLLQQFAIDKGYPHAFGHHMN